MVSIGKTVTYTNDEAARRRHSCGVSICGVKKGALCKVDHRETDTFRGHFFLARVDVVGGLQGRPPQQFSLRKLTKAFIA